jgi:uncharacterized membrane protein
MAMTKLLAAAAVFLAIHFLISGTRVRDGIVGTIGEGAYLALFSLASLGVIVWLAMAFNAASAQVGGPGDPILYTPGIGVRHMAIPVVLVAFLIGVPGLLSPNPTSVRQEGTAAKETTVRGILRVTRHPFLWGVAIWSAFHLAANGDQASVVLFGTFFVLAVLGTFSIDAKRKRSLGAGWTDFARKTSNIPFAAIIRGQNKFVVREYFDWRFVVAVLIFCAIIISHARIFGVSPFPNGWRPF